MDIIAGAMSAWIYKDLAPSLVLATRLSVGAYAREPHRACREYLLSGLLRSSSHMVRPKSRNSAYDSLLLATYAGGELSKGYCS